MFSDLAEEIHDFLFILLTHLYYDILQTYKKCKNNTLFSLVSTIELNNEGITNIYKTLLCMTP